MKIDRVFDRADTPRKATLLLVRADGNFSSKLALGQVIKGRVLRTLATNRYLVDFDGEEKVVDSVGALQSDEVLHGRVLSLGPQVELQRVHTAGETAHARHIAPEPKRVEVNVFAGLAERLVKELFQRYNASLSAADTTLLEQQVARVSDAQSMALSGLVLNKLGVRFSAELLRTVFEALVNKGRDGLFPVQDTAIRLSKYAQGVDPERSHRALAELLQHLLERLPEASQHEQGNDWGRSSDRQDSDTALEHCSLARWILNGQTGGSVAHRVTTLPLLIDGELVELDVALFDHTAMAQAQDEPAIAYRQIVLSLHTDGLGAVEVRAAFTGDHLRLSLSSDRSEATQFMSAYSGRLKGDLNDLGWTVDEVSYETRTADSLNGVMRSVVEHLVSPDSVSRLV